MTTEPDDPQQGQSSLPQAGAFLRASARFTAMLAGGCGAIGWWLGDATWALGIVMGALIGWGNLALLARALLQVVQTKEQHRPGRFGGWSLPAVLLLKWPLLLLVLAAVLLYLPARPEGVGIGVVLSLVAAAAAARPGTGRGR